jgi:hypothetical protein
MTEACFFCGVEKDKRGLVCPACGRDTAIPAPLADEHQALLSKRDSLRAELIDAKARLELHRRKPEKP